MNEILFTYLDNVVKKTRTEITHIEDTIEMSPSNPGVADGVYSLYKVEFSDDSYGYFILAMTGHASTVLEATFDLIRDLFSDFYKENERELVTLFNAVPNIGSIEASNNS